MEQIILEIIRRFSATDFFMSLPFWVAFALVVVAFRLSPENAVLKKPLMLTFSVGMLLMLPRFTLPTLLIFTTLCVVAYLFGSALNSSKLTHSFGRKLFAGAGITGVVCVLAFFKFRFVQEAIIAPKPDVAVSGSDFIFLIGISYSSFKAIHFITDGYKKAIKGGGSFLDFLNFMFFFPSFVSGPINRFNHFLENSALTRKSSIRADLMPGLERIIHGLFKKTVLTTVLLQWLPSNAGIPVEQMGFWHILFGLYAYALYSYLDFSGYTDLAIGCARLMGFVLPENFDFPFLKKNVQQFWAHWHMSLSTWLTDYIYWPIVRKMRKSDNLKQHPLLVSNIAIITTFLVCGIWHGEGMNFILWGAYQGLGIATVNIYQNWKRKVRDPKAVRYFKSSFSHYAGVFATFNFYAIGLVAFDPTLFNAFIRL